MVWRLKESADLQRRFKETFQETFSEEDHFRWLDRKCSSPLQFSLNLGTSPETNEVKGGRPKIRSHFSYEDKVDIGIVAALPDELDKFKEKITSNGFALDIVPKSKVDYFARIITSRGNSYNLVMAHSNDMGNSDSAVTTMKLIHLYDPTYIFLIGIAGGNKKFVSIP